MKRNSDGCIVKITLECLDNPDCTEDLVKIDTLIDVAYEYKEDEPKYDAGDMYSKDSIIETLTYGGHHVLNPLNENSKQAYIIDFIKYVAWFLQSGEQTRFDNVIFSLFITMKNDTVYCTIFEMKTFDVYKISFETEKRRITNLVKNEKGIDCKEYMYLLNLIAKIPEYRLLLETIIKNTNN
jgi:hypothetical protein